MKIILVSSLIAVSLGLTLLTEAYASTPPLSKISETTASPDTMLGRKVILLSNYKAKKCDGEGGELPGNTGYEILERGFKMTVDYKAVDGYVVSVIPFTALGDHDYDTIPEDNLTERQRYNRRYVRKSNEYIYFLIPEQDFFTLFQEWTIYRGSLTVGIPTIPAKLRFGNGGKGTDPRYFRFEGNVSLGLSLGWKYAFGKKKQYAVNGIIGFTIASVQVDSLTTKGSVSPSTSAASFSPHIALVFDINKFQIGLYTGIDFLYGPPNKSWVYRNQPWLGIGIGYSLFSADNNRDGKRDSGSAPNQRASFYN